MLIFNFVLKMFNFINNFFYIWDNKISMILIKNDNVNSYNNSNCIKLNIKMKKRNI